MTRPTPNPRPAPQAATLQRTTEGDATLVRVVGLVDERFEGFGELGATKAVVIDTSAMTRMTSFGVRQWIKALDAVPKTITDLYLLGCPTFFVDQLNMVLNFGGHARIITVTAPYSCTSCGIELGETVDVLAERATLVKDAADRECPRCGGKLELDEPPESYFAFASKYAAQNLHPAAARLLVSTKLYRAQAHDSIAEKPPRIIKLVHGAVTYFRISGRIGALFRARPFLVGAEGEIVIDMSDVERFDPAGQREWKRLVKTLSGQVQAVTLVDVDDSFLASAGDTVTLARNVSVTSVRVPYTCTECARVSRSSIELEHASWPLQFEPHVCTMCGGTCTCELASEALQPLRKAITQAPKASAKVIAQREELLSRAMTDARVAQAGEAASSALGADDTILGKYKIVRRLSTGGMADVFLANQIGIGGFEKPVALKRIQRKLLDSRHVAVDMFLNEAKIAGRLTHPNIVQVLDVGEVGGALYLAMEYVHGKDLRNVIKKLQPTKERLPLGDALYVVREVAQALHHAYWSTDLTGKRLAVVHRDVSPHNVILGYDGTVKLLDFGVAMSAVTEQNETMIVGKWQYMSPEATTSQVVDHRSDLFSLGVVLYLLCSGAMPFNATEPKAIVRKIRAGEYKPLSELTPVPGRLANMVDRMLAADPAARPQRGQDVANELAEIARANGLSSSPSQVAELLARLFPEDASGIVSEQGAIALQRVSSVTITPSSTARQSGKIDVSQTFKRTSSRMGAVGPDSDVSFSGVRSTSPPSAQIAAESAPRRSRALLLLFLLLVVAAGALAVNEYYFPWIDWLR